MLLLLPTPLVPLLGALACCSPRSPMRCAARSALARVPARPRRTRPATLPPAIVLIALGGAGARLVAVAGVPARARRAVRRRACASPSLASGSCLATSPARHALRARAWSSASTRCSPRSACSRRSPRPTRRPPRCSSLAAGRAARALRARARGRHRPVARARARLPRHRAAAARPARGGRRVHRPPHRGRRRALACASPSELGVDEDVRRDDRARRAAARHRQDRHPRRDHQQARPARRRRSGR